MKIAPRIPDGLSLLPFQEEGVDSVLAILSKNRAAIIGDEMGLGKTPQSIAVLNSLEWDSALIVVPASLKINWMRELKKWLIKPCEIGMVSPGKPFPHGDIVICNYDMLHKHPAVLERYWSVLICDEAHYLKNEKAKRTKLAMDIKSQYFIALTGTPILNRPIEIFTLAHRCAPWAFPNWYGFASRYCALQRTRFGLDASGASNLGELQDKLKRHCLVRRLKKDVLKDLPAKRRQIIELPPSKEMQVVLDRENMRWRLHEETLAKLSARRDRAEIADDENEYRDAVKELKACSEVAFADMSKLRQETALAKLPLCLAHTKDVLETVDKVVVFAHHKAVIAEIMHGLREFNPVRLMGDDSIEARQGAVDKFQNDKNCRVFVGGVKAAGVGITLTAASNCIFFETDWTPATISQAEDRLHRIGQKDSVLVQHLVLEGSLDATMSKTLVSKQGIIDFALDIGTTECGEMVKKKTSSYSKFGSHFNAGNRDAMLKGLKVLAGMDSDRASSRNGEGFSAFHTEIGHELAKKSFLTDGQAGYAAYLLNRYRRQVDVGILKAAGLLKDSGPI